MQSFGVETLAKKMKLWDGKEPFKFWKAYSGGNYFGEPKAFSIREYFILNKIAPSLGLKYDSEELPLSVKPDNKLSAADVMNLLAETYEGTEWDMTKNLKIERKNNNCHLLIFLSCPSGIPSSLQSISPHNTSISSQIYFFLGLPGTSITFPLILSMASTYTSTSATT